MKVNKQNKDKISRICWKLVFVNLQFNVLKILVNRLFGQIMLIAFTVATIATTITA
jgi:hypothetical protein